MNNFHGHHIRSWSQSGRVRGEKVQTFCWSCGPCGVREETTSKSKRARNIEAHEKEPIRR